MNSILQSIAGFVAIIAVAAAGVALSPDVGIILQPGYEHGYALCGPPDEIAVRAPGIEHIEGKTYTIYVNKGHKADAEVYGLHIKAADACVLTL